MLISLVKVLIAEDLRASFRRRLYWGYKYFFSPRGSLLRFVCNICGKRASFPRNSMMRENASCVHCGSSVRFRSIIHALSIELFGQALTIQDFPDRKDLSGAGMSDWDEYAKRLARKLDYVNTFYHQEPFLDIAAANIPVTGVYDFLIATDVFEHVSQPIARAFRNAHALLKPGGVFIFSVPCVDGETREHFPELHRFTIREEPGGWVLLNETIDGRQQRFDRLIFHGGPGTTVEMRLFGRNSLTENFAEAGFTEIKSHKESAEHFGIVWNPYIPEEAQYRPLIYGLAAEPWTARRR